MQLARISFRAISFENFLIRASLCDF